MSISLNFNYLPYKVKKNYFDLFTKNMIVNKQKVLVLIYVLTIMYILLCIQIIF